MHVFERVIHVKECYLFLVINTPLEWRLMIQSMCINDRERAPSAEFATKKTPNMIQLFMQQVFV